MKSITLLSALIVSVAVFLAPTVYAQPGPAATPPAAAKAPAKAPAKKKATETAPVEGQYATEADAKRQCGTDMVVWVNTSSKIYHVAASKSYGKTKRGTYMCQAQADRSGFRGVKAQRSPAKKT
jgi:hypothetical protein